MTENPMEQKTKPPIRILRLPEVMARTGLSRSTIYVRLAEGRFPRPVALWAGGPWGGSRPRWTNGSASASPRAGSTALGPVSAARPRGGFAGRQRPARFDEPARFAAAGEQPVGRV